MSKENGLDVVEGYIRNTRKNNSTFEFVQVSFAGGGKRWEWYNCDFCLRLMSNQKIFNTKFVDNGTIDRNHVST